LKLPARVRLWNEFFFSAPQLRRDPLGGWPVRRGLTIAAIVLGVAGAGYSFLGIVMTATFTLSGTGVAVYFVLFVVSLLTAGAGVLRLRRIARSHGDSSAA